MSQTEKSQMSKEDTNMAMNPLTKEELDKEFQAFVNSLEIRPPTPPKFKDGDESEANEVYMTDDDDDKENRDGQRPENDLECDEESCQPDDLYQ